MKNKKYRVFNLLPGSVKAEQPKNVVNEARTEATIYIYDEISWWGISAEWFVSQINALADVPVINLRVNCPGGDYFEAMAIQTAMAQHPAKFVVHIDGMAASAASFFIRGANKRIITNGGFLMIHRATGGAYGNGKVLMSGGELLNKIDDSIIEGNMKAASCDIEQATAWVDNETWFSAAEALENGFVDEVIEAEPVENKFDLYSVFNHVPDSIKNVVVEEQEQEEEPETEKKYDSSKDELELLSLMASN
jgi:ATP-dependent Clp protease protease subunit